MCLRKGNITLLYKISQQVVYNRQQNYKKKKKKIQGKHAQTSKYLKIRKKKQYCEKSFSWYLLLVSDRQEHMTYFGLFTQSHPQGHCTNTYSVNSASYVTHIGVISHYWHVWTLSYKLLVITNCNVYIWTVNSIYTLGDTNLSMNQHPKQNFCCINYHMQ